MQTVEPVRINAIDPETRRIKPDAIPRILKHHGIQPARGWWIHRITERDIDVFEFPPSKQGTCLACLVGSLAVNELGFTAEMYDGGPGARHPLIAITDEAQLFTVGYTRGLSDGWEGCHNLTFNSAFMTRKEYEQGFDDGKAAYKACEAAGMTIVR